MGRAIAIIAVVCLLGGGIYYGVRSGSMEMAEKRSETIVVPPAPADEVAAIRKLVAEYYAAMRAKEYERAAAMYEPGTFDGVPMAPAKMLEMTAEFDGVDEKASAEAIRIEGNKATAEIVIPKQKDAIISLELSQDGVPIGTVARRLHFAKHNGRWFIAKDSTQSELIGDPQETLEMLQRLGVK